MFFCNICVEDVELHPIEMCQSCCIGICPECGTRMRTLYARPENPTPDMLGIDAYNQYHELDNQ